MSAFAMIPVGKVKIAAIVRVGALASQIRLMLKDRLTLFVILVMMVALRPVNALSRAF
jgi:hypothetical protein